MSLHLPPYVFHFPFFLQMLPELGVSGQRQSEAFARMFGSTSAVDSQQVQTGPAAGSYAAGAAEAGGVSGPAAELFEVPCHVLPPMRTLVAQFMDAVLAPAVGRADTAEPGNKAMALGDDDADEDEDEDGAEAEKQVAGAASVTVAGTYSLGCSAPATVADPAQLDFMFDFWAAGKPVPMPPKVPT
jgi:hypothetical protein